MKLMKIKLMIQSLSPLAFLTIIKNFTFVYKDSSGNYYNIKQLVIGNISSNICLTIVYSVCLLWLLLSICFFIQFRAFLYTNTYEGDDITIQEEQTYKSLDFFMTLILPLVINDVDTWQGMSVFFITLIMISILLAKTDLFYANPVLTILGYRFFKFSFNKDINTKYICICDKKSSQILLKTKKATPIYRKITLNVYFIRERCK